MSAKNSNLYQQVSFSNILKIEDSSHLNTQAVGADSYD